MGIRPEFQPKQEAALPAVMRFEAGSILDKLKSSGLLAQGRAHVVGVEAIRAAFGARWAMRKEVVWDLTEAQLLKRVGSQAFAARLSDTEFIIITPKMEPEASRALAARVSRELFTHFLGERAQGQVSIKVVTDFVDEAVCCRPLTAEEMAAALADGEALPASSLAAASDIVVDDGAALEGQTPLTTVGGTRLRFSTSVDPIIDLRQWAVAGHRIEPKILFETTRVPLTAVERRNLLPHDVACIDRATLAKGLERLRSFEPGGRRLTLILTVSFLTVSSSWAMADLFAGIDPLTKSAMQGSVIWEIADFEAGVPATRLLDCMNALSPYGRAVFTRADRTTLKAVDDPSLGRCGVTFQPSTGFADEEAASEWLMGLSRVVARRSTTVVAANLPSKDLLFLASSIGFTHATVRSALAA